MSVAFVSQIQPKSVEEALKDDQWLSDNRAEPRGEVFEKGALGLSDNRANPRTNFEGFFWSRHRSLHSLQRRKTLKNALKPLRNSQKLRKYFRGVLEREFEEVTRERMEELCEMRGMARLFIGIRTCRVETAVSSDKVETAVSPFETAVSPCRNGETVVSPLLQGETMVPNPRRRWNLAAGLIKNWNLVLGEGLGAGTEIVVLVVD
ncbi:unnamed protein product [Sphenostylis stenocarpa]|uniref:Uncharacterized protein n=1 Tax=Sphenostylis stenocarpa TaxID=92480 RepID=A0AA86STA8_9FABA|nr:unnamed protein product [Sphenostylis stenocarpa]